MLELTWTTIHNMRSYLQPMWQWLNFLCIACIESKNDSSSWLKMLAEQTTVICHSRIMDVLFSVYVKLRSNTMGQLISIQRKPPDILLRLNASLLLFHVKAVMLKKCDLAAKYWPLFCLLRYIPFYWTDVWGLNPCSLRRSGLANYGKPSGDDLGVKSSHNNSCLPRLGDLKKLVTKT